MTPRTRSNCWARLTQANVTIVPVGKFVTFEGLDGSGKSTQLQRLAAHLTDAGHTVVVTREPGGTPLGERIRSLVLAEAREDGGACPQPETELALMCASRAQSVAEVIRPALARGAWVLCDRFHDATEAYQGGGRGLPLALIHDLHRILCHDLQPDLTLILDQDPGRSLERARRRVAAGGGEGRFEAETPAFFARVAAAYRALAQREPSRCHLIPAEGTAAEVEARIRAVVCPGMNS